MLEKFESNVIKMLLASGYNEMKIDGDLANQYNHKTYLKRDNHIVNFIDGDSLTKDEISKTSEDNYNLLSAIKDEFYFVMIQVVLFKDEISNDNKILLNELNKEIPNDKKFLVTSSIVLKNNKIDHYYDKSKINENFFEELKEIAKYDIENLTDDDINEYRSEKTLVILNIKPYVTYTILGINIILSIILFYLTTRTTHKFAWNFHEVYLEQFGAKFNALMDQGEYWRWVTPIFLHAGIVHLLSNSIGILIFGRLVETTFGRKKMFAIYMLSGIAGVLGSYLFAPTTTSVGASGAIFGLLGSLLYLGKKYKYSLNKGFTSSILVLIVLNLFMGLTADNIDNWAHIGGLIGGFFVARLLGAGKKKNKNKKLKHIQNEI